MIELSPEQVEDAYKMAIRNDLPNFSKAGTGKTHTTLEAIKLFNADQNLILCPPIAVGWWAEQARQYLGAEVNVLTGGGSKLGGDIHITTYDIARNAQARLYDHFRGGALAMDESHYVRRLDAGRTQAIFGKRGDGHGGLASCFDTAWCLTGTPMEGYADDMFTQAVTLHPEIWARHGVRTYEQFCDKFTFKRQKKYHAQMQPVWKISGNRNEGLLRHIVYQEVGAIRRLEAPNLPRLRLRELPVRIKLTREVRKAMEGLSPAEIVDKINGEDEALAKIWKVVGLAKVPEVVTYSGDLLHNGPLLIGCWHRDVMDEYEKAFMKMGKRVAQVNGSTSNAMKDSIRQDFNKGNIDVIVGQMRSMGVSWNIQEACSNVVVAETYPSSATVEQFYKRVYRRGQTRPVDVDFVIADNPIDEALDAVRRRKGESDERING